MNQAIFFRDLAYVFIAAMAGGALAWRLRQPLIIGYVLGGVCISPLTPGPAVSDVHTFELFAEIGVVLLMFSIGIEFSLRDLWRVKWLALVGGPIGIALSVLFGAAVGQLLGWPLMQGVIVGMVVSVASTMVLGRLLLDRGELRSSHGRIMIGITLVEDLAVVVLIALIPKLGKTDVGGLGQMLPAVGKVLLFLVPAAYLAWKTVPWLMTRVARTRSDELFLMTAVALGLGTAALSQMAGLSLALGAFIAGLVISESDYAHEALARLLSLRDAFVALFFVTIGALIDPYSLLSNVPLLVTMLLMIVVGKAVLWTAVVWAMRQSFATSLLVGIGLTQIGEFSFILVQVARNAGHVGTDVYNATLAASLLSILINALLVRVAPKWIAGMRAAREGRSTVEQRIEAGHAVICGFGRVGSAVGEALEVFGIPFVVIERDPDILQSLRARGIPVLFGDSSQRRILEEARTKDASLVVVALPHMDRSNLAVRNVRALNPTVPILARSHEAGGHEELAEAGATKVVRPELAAAATLIQYSLDELGVSSDRVIDYLSGFRGSIDTVRVGRLANEGLPQVHEINVGAAGPLSNATLGGARVRERYGVTVIAVVRAGNQLVPNPPPDTRIQPGDRLRVLGQAEQVEAFRDVVERELRP